MSVFKSNFKFPHSKLFTDFVGSKKKNNDSSFSIFHSLSNAFSCGKPVYARLSLTSDCPFGELSLQIGVPSPVMVTLELFDVNAQQVLETLFHGLYYGQWDFTDPFGYYQYAGKTVVVRYHSNGRTFVSNEVTIVECPNALISLLFGVCIEGVLTLTCFIQTSGISTVLPRTYSLQYWDGGSWVELASISSTGNEEKEINVAAAFLSCSDADFRVVVIDPDDAKELFVTDTYFAAFNCCE